MEGWFGTHQSCFNPLIFIETSTLLEKPRAVYRGVQQYSPITGQPEIYYPSWKRQAKFFVTYPATVLSIIFAIITTQLYLKLEGKVVDSLSGYSGIFITILTSIPTVLYTALIFKVNGYFGRIAVSLNNWGKVISFYMSANLSVAIWTVQAHKGPETLPCGTNNAKNIKTSENDLANTITFKS